MKKSVRAQITYTGGKTYWHGNTRFVQDVPKVVTDPATIEHCKQTAGFAVTVFGGKYGEGKVKAPKKSKVVRKVVADTTDE